MLWTKVSFLWKFESLNSIHNGDEFENFFSGKFSSDSIRPAEFKMLWKSIQVFFCSSLYLAIENNKIIRNCQIEVFVFKQTFLEHDSQITASELFYLFQLLHLFIRSLNLFFPLNNVKLIDSKLLYEILVLVQLGLRHIYSSLSFP